MFTLVARGPQGYKVVQYNAFRYLDLKEGSDGAHLIASVKPFQTLGPEYEMHFWPIDLLHFGRISSEEVILSENWSCQKPKSMVM